MKESRFKEQIKTDQIDDQYLFISDEPLLIDNAVKSIKDALKINEPFDYDMFSAPETPVEEILQKIYLTPFNSKKRQKPLRNLSRSSLVWSSSLKREAIWLI